MNPKKTKVDWQIEQHGQDRAAKQADELVARLDLARPIDPLKVVASEHPLLLAGGRDFKDGFDGKLKFNRQKQTFLLFYNTKYDAPLPAGVHHARTRFSIAHELGHYFIEHHHLYLRRCGRPHPSVSEFRSHVQIEREADAFAASLLLPTQLIRPLVNRAELSFDGIEDLVGRFETSYISTTIRAVRVSHFPCAVAGIREGRIAWMFASEALIDSGCYPGKRDIESPSAREKWESFRVGDNGRAIAEGLARHWFQMFDREDDLFAVQVTESFLPVRIMGTLVVLLTVDEAEVFDLEEDEDAEEEEERDRFGRSRG